MFPGHFPQVSTQDPLTPPWRAEGRDHEMLLSRLRELVGTELSQTLDHAASTRGCSPCIPCPSAPPLPYSRLPSPLPKHLGTPASRLPKPGLREQTRPPVHQRPETGTGHFDQEDVANGFRPAVPARGTLAEVTCAFPAGSRGRQEQRGWGKL